MPGVSLRGVDRHHSLKAQRSYACPLAITYVMPTGSRIFVCQISPTDVWPREAYRSALTSDDWRTGSAYDDEPCPATRAWTLTCCFHPSGPF